MIQWLKKRLAGTLGDKKDIIKEWPIVKNINSRANKKLDSSKNMLLKDNFSNILNDIYNIKDEKLKLWLDFGTLLGMYRDKGIVAHDLDMDFGVSFDQLELFEEFMLKLENKGYKKTREFYYNNIPVEYSFSYKGLNIDFVIYRKKDEFIETETIAYLQNLSGNPSHIESYHLKIPFNGVYELQYEGILLEVPINEKVYLSHIYGDNFMTPIKNYDWRSNPTYTQVDADKAVVKLN